MDDFVQCLSLIGSQLRSVPVEQLEWIRHSARIHVRQNFNRVKNVQLFADVILQRIAPQSEITPDESPLLQQI